MTDRDKTQDFRSWYHAMSKPDREAFCRRARLTRAYVEINLIPERTGKTPSLITIERIAEASGGALDFLGLVQYFVDRRKRIEEAKNG